MSVQQEMAVESPATSSEVRLTGKRFVFYALLDKASSVVPNADVIPVLKNFQLKATPQGLTVLATDLELSVISSTVMVEVERPGTVVIPAAALLDIVKSAADEEMVIDVVGQTVSINCAGSSWELNLQSGDEYPDLPDVSEADTYAVDRALFMHAISSVRLAASTDVTRANLMMLDIRDSVMTACDGSRFQRIPIGSDLPIDIQIPIGAVGDLYKLLRSSDLPTLGIAETEDHLIFRLGNDSFVANKFMAIFPDLDSALLEPAEKSNTDKLTVDREELDTAVRRVRITADPETSAIRLQLSDGGLVVSSQNKRGDNASEKLTVGWSSGDRTLMVNHQYLSQMLDMYDGKVINFLIGVDTKSKRQPLLLKDESTHAIGLIQQMRLDWKS